MSSPVQSRRRVTFALLLCLVWRPARSQGAVADIEVWKSPTCGCCKDWITYLEGSGFRVKVHDTGNNAMRSRLGMPSKFGSCHTAQIGKYVLEGHVPSREINRLLREQPRAVGLSVPNMPVGAPGMDGPQYGQRRDPFDVLLVQADGSAKVYASYFRPGTT
jgi:hypothetical protein